MIENPDPTSAAPGQTPGPLAEESSRFLREGEEHFGAGRLEEAANAFILALGEDPGNVDAMNNLGVITWQAGETAGALAWFEKVLAIDPGNADAAHNLQAILESVHGAGGAEGTLAPEIDCLRVNVRGGLHVCVPPSIANMTPYILLEQEDWFEDEIHFIRKLITQGMNVIDIGANYGLYTLTLGKLAGSGGRVWAFEPTSRTASYLRRSILENSLTHVTLVQAGLSDRNGTAKISLNSNPELNEVTDDPAARGDYETITLLNLDSCAGAFAWQDIGFIKLDAEGQECNILKGGDGFLSSRSPLIMFELKHCSHVNTELLGAFLTRGYRLYRLVPGLGILVPFDEKGHIDAYQLNLFCCKDDRARLLEERGLLITAFPVPEPLPRRSLWRSGLAKMPFFAPLTASLPDADAEPVEGREHYEDALSFYAMAADPDRGPAARYASLSAAFGEMQRALKKGMTLPRLLTHIRILSDIGRREEAVQAVESALHLIQTEKKVPVSEPFLPPSPRFDAIVPDESGVNRWLAASLLEYGEKARTFSSFYTDGSTLTALETMKGMGYQSPEMERRRQLIRMRFGLQKEPAFDPIVAAATGDNLNPDFWKSGEEFRKMGKSLVTLFGLKLESMIHILDIGAMDICEGGNPYDALLSGGLARVTGFEPLEKECARLNETVSESRRFLPYALGDGTKMPFHITNTGATSSLFEPNHALTSLFHNLDELMQVVETIEIQTVRLDDVKDLGEVDFVKIDVQGAEKMIFENARQMLENTLVIQTEVEFVPLYKKQPLFSDIDLFLRGRGFEFHQFLGYSGRTFKPLGVNMDPNRPLSQYLWTDAVYVKDFMKLDRLSDEKLLKFAVIMYEIFHSVDLCHLILAEYDRRAGTALAKRCVQLYRENRL